MRSYVKKLDYFGYNPNFLISGENSYKTFGGGLIFLIFIIIGIIWIAFTFSNYYKEFDFVQSLTNYLKSSNNFTINTKDLYFGIGFINGMYTAYNYSKEFSFLNISAQIMQIVNGTRKNYPIKLSNCKIKNFLGLDQEKYNSSEMQEIVSKVQFYICPDDSNFSLEIRPSKFNEDVLTLQVDIDFYNTSNFTDAKEIFSQLKPRIYLRDLLIIFTMKLISNLRKNLKLIYHLMKFLMI